MLNSRELFRFIRDTLNEDIPLGEREAIAFLILEHNGISKNQVVANAFIEKSSADVQIIIEAVNTGIPIQYVLGSARFYGLDVLVNPSVLIPRTETEELVSLVLKSFKGRTNLKVLDLCTGSGAIALAIANSEPSWSITATDISEAAIKVAQENSKKIDVGVKFILHDALSSVMPDDEKFDVLVSNPPYIDEGEKPAMLASVLKHEPSLALFTPPGKPLAFYQSICSLAAKHLIAGGMVAVELNPVYSEQVSALFSDIFFSEKEIHLDSSGFKRFFTAHRN